MAEDVRSDETGDVARGDGDPLDEDRLDEVSGGWDRAADPESMRTIGPRCSPA